MLYLINFKTYSKGTGQNALRLANIIAEVAERRKVEIIPAVQPTDLKEICKITSAISQAIDPIPYGAHTGQILPQAIKDAGAIGTLINHSERRLSIKDIESCIYFARHACLKTIVCASDIKEAMDIAKLSPDYIAFEDPELIGTGQSVSKTKPELVSRFVGVLKDLSPLVIPLCGAGITNHEDVLAAKDLGTKGVLVASAVVNAEDQKEALEKLII